MAEKFGSKSNPMVPSSALLSGAAFGAGTSAPWGGWRHHTLANIRAKGCALSEPGGALGTGGGTKPRRTSRAKGVCVTAMLADLRRRAPGRGSDSGRSIRLGSGGAMSSSRRAIVVAGRPWPPEPRRRPGRRSTPGKRSPRGCTSTPFVEGGAPRQRARRRTARRRVRWRVRRGWLSRAPNGEAPPLRRATEPRA